MSDGPWGDAWDVAYAALFLASAEVKYITRAAPVVDQRNAGRGVITQSNRRPGCDFIAVSHRKKRALLYRGRRLQTSADSARRAYGGIYSDNHLL